MILDKFPDASQLSDADKAKILRVYELIEAYIKETKLEDARKKLAESEQRKDNDQQTSTDTDSV